MIPEGSSPQQRLRITHLVTNAEFAGTERYVVDVSSQLHQRGHDVVVIGGKPESMRRLLPKGVRWYPGATAPAAVKALATGGRRDIVHSHNAKADFVSLMSSPATGGRRFSTRHITAARGYSNAARRLGRIVRAGLSAEIAVSEWTSAQLERPADFVLLNGVASQPDVTFQRQPVVLLAQRLDPEKDSATALRAWAKTELGLDGWRLRVAGSGREQNSLELIAAELGITDSVEFAGWLPELRDEYRRAAVFLAPAPTEPCGLSILEAMAQGMPVVAAAAGGPLETVGRSENAVLFPVGDAQAAADALLQLAGDPLLRERYGNELRELQRTTFSVEHHVDQLECLYRGRPS